MKKLFISKWGRLSLRAFLFTLLLAAAGLTNATAQTFTVGNLNYSINDDGASVTVTGHVDDIIGKLVIPESVELYGTSYSVTGIGNEAFNSCENLTSLVLPNSLTSIGNYAFNYCWQMTGALTIPENVSFIGYYAFASCYGISSLNYNARNCGLEWNTQWYSWLDDCYSLSTVSIGENVRTIPQWFMKNCTSVTGNLIIPDGVTTIGEDAFYGCTGFNGTLTLGNSLVTIKSNAFNGCNGFIGSLVIPDNVEYLENNAFFGCSGFSGTLTLGSSLTEIGNSAFFGACEGFTSMEVWAENPPTLGNNVFVSANYDMPVQVPCGTTEDYQNASGWNMFANIIESDPCQWLIQATARPDFGGTISGAGMYEEGSTCTLTATAASGWTFLRWTEDGQVVSTDATYSFTVEGNRNLVALFTNPDFITFADPDVEAICVDRWDSNGDGLLSYEEAAAVTDLERFYWNDNIDSFDELQYFTGVTSLHNEAFSYCHNLTSIILPESINTIEYYAFYDCNSLSSITLPESLTNIGDWVFTSNTLTNITIHAVTPPELGYCAFCFDHYNTVVTVPCGSTASYQNADGWNEFNNYQEPDDCVYDITVTLNHEEAGAVSGAGSYQKGTTCTLVATPATDCTFKNWMENGQIVSTEAEYSFIVTGPRNLVANFGLPIFTINATPNPTEGGTTSFGSYDFEDGTLQGWTAFDADGDGLNWYVVNSSNLFSNDYSLDYTGPYVVMSRSWDGYAFNVDNWLISPQFSLDNILTYWVRDDGNYHDHYEVYVSTTTNDIDAFSLLYTPGYASNDWMQHVIDLSSYNGQMGYIAFRHTDYDQNWLLIDGITRMSSTGTYEQGQTCTMTAIPNYGYEFENWTENGSMISTDVEYSFTVTEDHNFVVNFTKVPFAINAEPNFSDRGTVRGTGTYVIDDRCTLTAIPNTGHRFVRWMENGEEVSTEASYTFTVAGPRDLVAVFTAPIADLINFADPNVKAVCANNWDTDGDSELTYAEAAAVTNLNYAFNYNEYITSFDELQYFTGLTYINESEFSNCYALASIIIPEGVTYIGYYAFGECYDLESVTFPSALETIDEWAFYSCVGLTNVEFPSSVTTIGDGAFQECSNLASLALPESLEYIGNQAFYICSNLTGTLEIPASVTYIGSHAFRECSSLTSLVLSENVVTIGNNAFRNCSGLRDEITLPESLEYIGERAFFGCDGISTVNYNAVNCTYMGSAEGPVFYDCAFPRLNIGENVENIPNFAFKRCFMLTEMNVAAVVPPTIYSSTFGMVSRSIPVSVPYGSGDVYRSTQYWEEFFNITEDYTPTPYAYHWNLDIHQFESNMTVIGVIQINGVEQESNALEIGAFVGDECRGRQMLAYYPMADRYLVFLMLYGDEEDASVFSFRLYDHETQAELMMSCATQITFEVNGTLGEPDDPYVFDFSSGQSSSFALGWNWWSSYIEADDLMDQMKAGLGADGKQIKSQTKFTMNYGTTWMGQLNSIENDKTYMIQTLAPCAVELSGTPVNPADYPITLNTGWKWIGYPCTTTMSVNEALAGITPTAGDQIKAQGSFATYYNNIGWMGTLKKLNPGVGYMYKLNGASQTLVFPSGSRNMEVEENITADGNHWMPDVYAFPSNMTIMAVVELDNVELASDNYELAAFANGEVRGSARLMYVEPLNRWMAFLTISGDEAADLYFGLYDVETGMECFDNSDAIVYATDASLGSFDEPMVIRFRGTTSLNDLESSLQVYPNPVARGERVSINLPVDSKVRVEVVNALGAVISTETSTMAPAAINTPASSGVYTLRITVDGKGTYYRKLVVE